VALGVEDVVAALRSSRRWVGRPRVAPAPAVTGTVAPGSAASSRVLEHLTVEEPRHVDDLAASSGLGVPDLLVELGELVASGRVRRLPGQLFQRCLLAGGNAVS
jgi:predicted Rossmann fold nucleotide-binding protein DprA/Smf involved in DNA uptake